MKYSFALVAFFAGYVAAQTECITTCSTQAAQTACDGGSFADPSCACENTAFQQAALACLQENCTAAEQQQALQLQQTLCGASSGTASASASEPVETESLTESEPEETATATAPLSSVVASATSRASSIIASVTSRTASVVASASSNVASRTSTAGAATSSAPANGASGLAVVNLAAAGTWAAVALGGAVVAQYAL